ncbi:MAG: alpha-galactosidase [Candidatus Dormibacteria bacterium]
MDGYHSWDWAGLRSLGEPGAGWWGGIAGSHATFEALAVRLLEPPTIGPLRVAWDGAGAIDLLATGPAAQEWERTGSPGDLTRLVSGELVGADPVLLARLDPGERAGAALPRAAGSRLPGPRQVGWMSWNCLGPSVTAADARAAVGLVPPGGVVIVDDGWEVAWGDWRVSPRFGGSLARLSGELSSNGVRLGCWLAPFLVDPTSALVHRHPEWLLRDRDGAPVLDTRPTPAMAVLDGSLPEVRAHLAATGARLGRAGVRVIKADFLYAGASDGVRRSGVAGVAALRAGMTALVKAFLEATDNAGTVWLCGSPAPALVGLGDACRSGGDAVLAIPGTNVERVPGPHFVHGAPILDAQERNLAARAWLWGATLPPDVDAVTLGPVGDTPAVDDHTATRWLALAERAGGPLLDADAELPGVRRALLRAAQQRVAGRAPHAERSVHPLAGTPAPPGDDHFLSHPA